MSALPDNTPVPMAPVREARPAPCAWRLLEVGRVFLILGCTSFGGPFAHLAYIRSAVVARRGWLGDAAYGDLVGLCQLLPGPSSSQLCALIGFQRAGWAGALAAWAAFCAPSAALMLGGALVGVRADPVLAAGALHGLTVAALAVVALAAWSMVPRLANDTRRRLIALAVAAGLVLAPDPALQLVLLAGAGIAGALFVRVEAAASSAAGLRVPGRSAAAAGLAVVLALLALPPLLGLGALPRVLAVAAVLARAGALVVGGGHVVLPLLQSQLVAPGLVDEGAFLHAYGLAQLMPGPLFSFSAYLGATLPTASMFGALAAGALALVALSLPGLLLALCALRALPALAGSARLGAVLAGLGAGALGLLAAALVNPLARAAIQGADDVALLVAALLALQLLRWPSAAVAVGCAVVAALA